MYEAIRPDTIAGITDPQMEIDRLERVVLESLGRIKALREALPACRDYKTQPGCCYAAVEPVYRADYESTPEMILQAMDRGLVLKDNAGCDKMSLEQFRKYETEGRISDRDGAADLVVDSRVSENTLLWLGDQMLLIYGRYMIPFDLVPELFKGHDIGIYWFNK